MLEGYEPGEGLFTLTYAVCHIDEENLKYLAG